MTHVLRDRPPPPPHMQPFTLLPHAGTHFSGFPPFTCLFLLFPQIKHLANF